MMRRGEQRVSAEPSGSWYADEANIVSEVAELAEIEVFQKRRES
jgi:hypothetical protein